jgi:NAD(P)-dependent dehydrogenase (short-subunit alcohol dehydrogenase family)
MLASATVVEAKVVIVTGAARGLGRAIALGMLDVGARVVAVCRPRGAGEAAGPLADSASFLQLEADVTSELDCTRIAANALEHFGSVDVLVNNAAISHDPFPKMHDSQFTDVAADVWRRVIDVNVNGAFLMARATVPGMIARGWGRVINISTSQGSMLAKGVLPYGPSKAALEAMTVGWAAALANSGVTVNEVLPGGPTGPRTPQKHWWPEGSRSWPADMMVPPIRWLSSPASDGTTGRRFVARLWDASLTDTEAAGLSSFPAGWPLSPEDTARRPSG